jgi:hypothetical protein
VSLPVHIRVLAAHARGPLGAELIEGSLSALQTFVGGSIEGIELGVTGDGARLVAIANEEGRLLGLPANIHFPPIVGDFFVARDVDGELVSLTNNDLAAITALFADARAGGRPDVRRGRYHALLLGCPSREEAIRLRDLIRGQRAYACEGFRFDAPDGAVLTAHVVGPNRADVHPDYPYAVAVGCRRQEGQGA